MVHTVNPSASQQTYLLKNEHKAPYLVFTLPSFLSKLMNHVRAAKFHLPVLLLLLHNCLCFTLLSCQNQLAVSQRCISYFLSTPKQPNVITVAPYCICQTLPSCPHSFISLEIHFESKLPVYFHPLRLGLTFTSPFLTSTLILAALTGHSLLS